MMTKLTLFPHQDYLFSVKVSQKAEGGNRRKVIFLFFNALLGEAGIIKIQVQDQDQVQDQGGSWV